MNYQFKTLELPEVIVFMPEKFFDERGFFYESFNSFKFTKETGKIFNILQENISLSKKNVLRGLHFQKGEHQQSKLIHVEKGRILDVIVDIRPGSKNFRKWISYELDDNINESIFIPRGFAHGFLTLEDFTKISYKVDNLYNKNSECSISWNDPELMIDWQSINPILSKKDMIAISFEENFQKNNFMTKEII